MTRLTTLAVFVVWALTAGPVAFAHEGNEHVRGTVKAIDAHSITVQTTATATRVLTIDDKTTFKKSGKAAMVADLKVGDRVVIDVPQKTALARLVQFGPPSHAAK